MQYEEMDALTFRARQECQLTKRLMSNDLKHILGIENGLDKIQAKYEKATGKKMNLTQSSFDEFLEWVKVNEPDFYNSYKRV